MNSFQAMSDEEFQALLDDLDDWDRRERENDIPDELKTIEGYGDGWKDIKEFPNYRVNIYGEIYSKKRKKIMSPSDSEKGYDQIVLRRNGKAYTKKVHVLTAETFIPNPENKSDINHKDGCKKNNRITNLEWNTHSENMKHAYKHGLITMPDNGRNPKQKVRIKETGQVFESISDCARYLFDGKTRSSDVCRCLSGERHTCKGFHFEAVCDEY